VADRERRERANFDSRIRAGPRVGRHATRVANLGIRVSPASPFSPLHRFSRRSPLRFASNSGDSGEARRAIAVAPAASCFLDPVAFAIAVNDARCLRRKYDRERNENRASPCIPRKALLARRLLLLLLLLLLLHPRVSILLVDSSFSGSRVARENNGERPLTDAFSRKALARA